MGMYKLQAQWDNVIAEAAAQPAIILNMMNSTRDIWCMNWSHQASTGGGRHWNTINDSSRPANAGM